MVAIHCTCYVCSVCIFLLDTFPVCYYCYIGGSAIILRYSGNVDATSAFHEIHNNDIINLLPVEAKIGMISENDRQTLNKQPTTKTKNAHTNSNNNGNGNTARSLSSVSASSDTVDPNKAVSGYSRPAIESMFNVFDFESVAIKNMNKEGLDYYQSAGDDEITLRENRMAFQRIWFKPRYEMHIYIISSRIVFRCYLVRFFWWFMLLLFYYAIASLINVLLLSLHVV